MTLSANWSLDADNTIPDATLENYFATKADCADFKSNTRAIFPEPFKPKHKPKKIMTPVEGVIKESKINESIKWLCRNS